MSDDKPLVLDFSQVGAGDVALVGGKCASLGEMFRELTEQGVRSVDGYSTTSFAGTCKNCSRGWMSITLPSWPGSAAKRAA
jgi:hypothetical protein